MLSRSTCRICLDTKCADLVTFQVEGTDWAHLYEFCVGASESCAQQICAFGRNCADQLYGFAEFKKKCLKNDAAWRQMCNEANEINEEVQVKEDVIDEVPDGCVEQIINVSGSADSKHDIKGFMGTSSAKTHESTLGESCLDTENPFQDPPKEIIHTGCLFNNSGNEGDRDDRDTGNVNFDSPTLPQTETGYIKIEIKSEDTESEQQDPLIIPRKHQVSSAECAVTEPEDQKVGSDNESNSILSRMNTNDNISFNRNKVIIPSQYNVCSAQNDSNSNSRKPNIISRRLLGICRRWAKKVIIPTKYKVGSAEFANKEPRDGMTTVGKDIESNSTLSTINRNNNVTRKRKRVLIVPIKYKACSSLKANDEPNDKTIDNESDIISEKTDTNVNVSGITKQVFVPMKYKAWSAKYDDNDPKDKTVKKINIVPRKTNEVTIPMHKLDSAKQAVSKPVDEIIGKGNESNSISSKRYTPNIICSKGKLVIIPTPSSSANNANNKPDDNTIGKHNESDIISSEVTTNYNIYRKRKKIIIPTKYKVCSAENANNESDESDIISRKVKRYENIARNRNKIIIPTKYKVCLAEQSVSKPDDEIIRKHYETNNSSRKRNKLENISTDRKLKVIVPTKYKLLSTDKAINELDDDKIKSEDISIGNDNESIHISENFNEPDHVSRKGRKVIISKNFKVCYSESSDQYSDSSEDEDLPITNDPESRDPDYNPSSDEEDDNLEYEDKEAVRLKEIKELRGDAPKIKKEPYITKPYVKKVKLPPAPCYYCGICEYQCSYIKDLRTHWNDHVEKNNLDCKLCDYMGRDFADMAAHRMKHQPPEFSHNDGCMKCCTRFEVADQMEFHYRSKHLRKKGGWCRVCGKEFVVYTTFIDHQSGHEAPLTCDCCGKKFSRQSLIKHLRPKKHVCDQCGKGFTTATCLKHHLSSHSTNYHVKCDHCDKSFRSEKDLSTHKYRMKQQNVCDVCGAVFKRKVNLESHQKTHNDAMPYSCNICGKEFKWKGNLTAHILRHERKRNE